MENQTTSRPVTVSRDQVKQTEHFLGMTKIRQSIVIGFDNVNKISHGVNVALNIGVVEFEKMTDLTPWNVEIVKEIINSNTK